MGEGNIPVETNFRLRSVLNGDQPGRERLGMAVLSLSPEYLDIRPRRPEGGPDGGRDIEARKAGERCFGAVGFQNNVSDSTAEKRQVREKFSDDLESATKADPNLKCFVFLTNVDLTPGEVSDLQQVAREKGIADCDVYWRERIAMALNQTGGFAYRFQFLGMKLTDEEQISFFNRFGSDLSRIVSHQFQSVSQRLDRIDLNIWKSQPLKQLRFDVELKKAVTANQLGHFRILCTLETVGHANRNVYIGGRDNYGPKAERRSFGTRSIFGLGGVSKHNLEFSGSNSSGPNGPIDHMSFSVGWYGPPPNHGFVTPLILERLDPRLDYSENLHGLLKRIRLSAYPYVIFDLCTDLDGKPGGIYAKWPDGDLTAEESEVKWFTNISLRTPHINFEHLNPVKMDDLYL